MKMQENLTAPDQVAAIAGRLLDKAKAGGGLRRVYCVACGGSLGGLYPLDYLIRTETKSLFVTSVTANEFVHATPAGVDANALVVVMSLPSSSSTPSSSTKAPRVPEPSSREMTVMGPEAEVPSALASLLSSAWLLSWAAEEVPEEVESVPSEAELLLLSPQPASMEAHSIRANMAERTFFMVMTFLLFFLDNVLLGYLTAYMINTQCKVREGGKVKSV